MSSPDSSERTAKGDQAHEDRRDDPESQNGLDEARENQPHKAVGFWHSDLAKTRRKVIFGWMKTTLLLMTCILGVLSLYWAVLFRVYPNLAALEVHVVDFDGIAPYDGGEPLVGPLVTRTIAQMRAQEFSLGYTVLPASQFANDPMRVREAVYDWDAWAAIIVNPNATSLLRAAVETGNRTYDPTGAVQIIIQTARDQTTVESYMLPYLDMFVSQFQAEFGPMWSEMVVGNASLSRQNLVAAATAVNPGVVPLMYDLRPFEPVTATPAVTIGLIYLIIMAFFSFSFFLPIHMQYVKPEGHPPLKYWHYIIWRWLATETTYFFISLVYSLISVAFQIPFWPEPWDHVTSPPPWGATAYGKGTFPVYWMLNWVGMSGLGLACENVAMIIGQPWTAIWLIFWVITNVSTSFYAIELSPGFYHWGYAWPLYHIVQASRQLLFNLHSRIGLNFGILFVWAAIGSALFPLCCYFQRWNMDRQQRQKEKDEEEFKVDQGESGERKFGKGKGEKPPIRRRGFLRGV